MSTSSEVSPLTELLSSSTASVGTERVPEIPDEVVVQSTGGTENATESTSSSVTMELELVPLVNVNGTTEEIVQQEETTSSIMNSTETMESTPPPVNMSDFTDGNFF